jgi:hypothetical protein
MKQSVEPNSTSGKRNRRHDSLILTFLTRTSVSSVNAWELHNGPSTGSTNPLAVSGMLGVTAGHRPSPQGREVVCSPAGGRCRTLVNEGAIRILAQLGPSSAPASVTLHFRTRYVPPASTAPGTAISDFRSILTRLVETSTLADFTSSST